MDALFPPYNQFQSHNATASSDCAACAALWALRWATDGDIGPTSRDKIDDALREIRRIADPQSNPPGISLREIEVAYEKFGSRHADPAPRMKRKSGGDVEDELWPAVSNGRIALVNVSYGVVNKRRPDLSGSKGFDDGHAIVIVNGRTEQSGRRVVTIADSTRNRLVKWPWWLVVRAAGKYGSNPWGVGRGEFGLLRRTRSNEAEEPHPARQPDPDERIARLRRLVANLREELQDLEAELAASADERKELKATIKRLREALERAENEGSPEELETIVDETMTGAIGIDPEPAEPAEGELTDGVPQDQPGEEDLEDLAA